MGKRYITAAPAFRQSGIVKEFVTKGGRGYLIVGFGDGSALVLRKVRGSKGAAADFKPVKGRGQKEALKRLGARYSGTTYEMAWNVLEGKIRKGGR